MPGAVLQTQTLNPLAEVAQPCAAGQSHITSTQEGHPRPATALVQGPRSETLASLQNASERTNFRARVRSSADICTDVPATIMGQRPQKAHSTSADETTSTQRCRYIGSVEDVFH